MSPTGIFSIGYRLSLYILIIALLVVAVIASGIFYYSYRLQVQDIEENISEIQNRTVPQITKSIWDYDEKQTTAELLALSKIRHVSLVEIKAGEQSSSLGNTQGEDIVSRQFDLVHGNDGRIGTLNIHFSLASARQAVFKETKVFAALVLIPLLIMALATIRLFQNLVTKHLDALARYSRSLTVDTLDLKFQFNRKSHQQPDELDRLLNAINSMRANLLEEIQSRREAEQKLGETEQYYREIFNSTGDAIFIHEAGTGKILDVNQTMMDMYLCSYQEALTSIPTDFSSNLDGQSPETALEKLKKSAIGGSQIFEWLARRKNGETFWVEVFLKSMTPFDPDKILASVRDISARKTAEEQLLHIQKMETIGQLAGGIAHDFNNLLTGILGAAELISMETDNAEIQDELNLIVNTANRAADLTGQLLTFARKSPVVLGLQNIHEIVQDIALILERSIDKHIRLDLKLGSPSYLVQGDHSQLQSAILNLGLNARDAMPNGGVLSILTENIELESEDCRKISSNLEPGKYIKISIRDTGMGMSEEVQKKVFEPFYTTKQVGKGTGLGLASVFGMAKSHQGAVNFTSELGAGTTFHLYLPLSSGIQTEAPRAPVKISPGTGCVLVVDDEEILRVTARNILEKSDFRVLLASDGEEGLETYRMHQKEIDLVLLDMIMPNLNGEKTFKAIRNINPRAFIVIASGFSQDQAVAKLLDNGNAAFLRKPFQKTDLLRTIQGLLSS